MPRLNVSVIVPIRNEERYIGGCLQSLLAQTVSLDSYEILVVDGRSSDRSKNIVEEIARTFRNVRLLDNSAAVVPAAMNLGIRNALGEIVIRADGHNLYPGDYIEKCVRYLKETGAENVGGPWRTVAADNTFGARLVAAVLTNPFGVGDSRFRTSSYEGFVDTVPFGAFRRDLFDRVGLYDEKLVRNQDNELNARIRSAGGKIFQTPALTTEYHPIATFLEFLKQSYKTSQWHIFTVKENGRSMSARHFAPAFLVVLMGILLGGSFYSHFCEVSLGVILGSYLMTGAYFALRRSRSHGLGIMCALAPACLMFHLAYGLGTLAGLRYLFVAPPSGPIRAGQAINLQ